MLLIEEAEGKKKKKNLQRRSSNGGVERKSLFESDEKGERIIK